MVIDFKIIKGLVFTARPFAGRIDCQGVRRPKIILLPDYFGGEGFDALLLNA